MSEQKAFLERVHIKNYLSLRNVTLPLKPLTVLVGPNASGKSNVLGALRFFKRVIIDKTFPLRLNKIQNSVFGQVKSDLHHLSNCTARDKRKPSSKYRFKYSEQKLKIVLMSRKRLSVNDVHDHICSGRKG